MRQERLVLPYQEYVGWNIVVPQQPPLGEVSSQGEGGFRREVNPFGGPGMRRTVKHVRGEGDIAMVEHGRVGA